MGTWHEHREYDEARGLAVLIAGGVVIANIIGYGLKYIFANPVHKELGEKQDVIERKMAQLEGLRQQMPRPISDNSQEG